MSVSSNLVMMMTIFRSRACAAIVRSTLATLPVVTPASMSLTPVRNTTTS